MMDHIIMPLLRGLSLRSSKRPRVVYKSLKALKTIPAEALTVNFDSVVGEKGLDEGGAARLLTETFDSWTFDHALSGAAAAAAGDRAPIRLPSCALVSVGGKTSAYWFGADLEDAKSRADRGDASAIVFAPPSLHSEKRSATERSRVVDGKIALVTGGAQGFGEEIVRGLAASGALVFAADINRDGAEALAKELNASFGKTRVFPLAIDVTKEKSVEAAFQTVAKTLGGLDLVISNAGILKAGSVLEQDLDSFKLVTDVNYIGFFLVAKHGGGLLRRQWRTAPAWYTDIIQINSKSGLAGSNKNGAYAGGKFGGIGLTASFALELVAYRIKVNAVCPGNFFDGPLWSDKDKGLFVQYLAAGKVAGARSIADVRAHYEAKVPLGRGCAGEDVMKAIYYIVEQEYETGQAVPVTGGQLMLH